MIMRVLCIVALMLTFISASSYSIDLPYITFGQKESKSDTKSNDKNMDKMTNPDNKDAQFSFRRVTEEQISFRRVTEEKTSIDFTQPFTLKQCIDIAVKESPSMKVAKINLSQGDINIQDAKANYLPGVNVSGSYMFSDKVDFGWEKENYNSSLDASYIIWDHGQRKSTLAQAKANKDAENSRYLRTKQSLIFNVISGYYGLLQTEKIIAVDEQLLEISKRNVDKITAFIEKGWATEADLATARVQQANNELSMLNDYNNLELARANLAVVLGQDPEMPIKVIDDPDYEAYIKTGSIEKEQVSPEEMKSKSLVSRPELTELKANQTILQLAAKLAKLERFPKLSADTNYNMMVDDYLRERNAIKNYTSWNVMTTLSFSLFDGGRSLRTVQKAELALQKINENKYELEQNITLEVRQAYLDFERAKKALDITAVQVEDAKLSLDVTEGRYETLMDITLLELLDVQTRYAKALSDRVKVFYDYKIARRSLEKAIGILQ